MPKHRNDRAPSPVRAGKLGLGYVGAIAPWLLAACSGDVINLGEREDAIAVPPHSRCQGSTTLDGPVRVESQEQLDALEGCEVIAGDLDIVAFPEGNLRSLHALTHVEGAVTIGGHAPVGSDFAGLTSEEVFERLEAYGARMSDWLHSLEGLERLETVDALAISAPVSSVLPLSALRRINTGHLRISSGVLESLAGLDAVRGFDTFSVEGAELRDISAIRLPETMKALLIHAPIEALNASELKSADIVDLGGTALEDLDALENLEVVDDHLYITGNQQLSDMNGLNRVRRIGDLDVQDNPVLERMGDFASLELLETIHIEGNASLTALPSFPSYYQSIGNTFFPGRTVIDVEHIWIGDNESLGRFVMPARWRAANLVEIIAARHLDAIDFVNLQSVGTLIVSMNSVLTEVNLGALSSAAYLDVRNNTVLSPTAFDGVRSLESDIKDNAPAP